LFWTISSAESLRRIVLCRGRSRSMNSWRGVPPVETILGLLFNLGRRTCCSSVFVMWQVSVQLNVQDRRGQNMRRDSGSGLILGDFSRSDMLSVFTLKRSIAWRLRVYVLDYACSSLFLGTCSEVVAYGPVGGNVSSPPEERPLNATGCQTPDCEDWDPDYESV
jgi:hypothetical protein